MDLSLEKQRMWSFSAVVAQQGPVCLFCAVGTLNREKLLLVGKCNEVE